MYIQRLFFLLCLGYHLCIKKMKKKTHSSNDSLFEIHEDSS